MTERLTDSGLPRAAPLDHEAGLLRIQIRHEEQQVALVLCGEADVSTGVFLAGAIGRAANERLPVVLDLGGLTFIDAHSIGLIVGAVRSLREHGIDLVVRSPRPNVRHLLVILGLAALIEHRGPPHVIGGSA